MKILITGIAGFVGSNMAIYFHERGHEVIGIDSLIREGVEHNWKELSLLGIKLHKGDIYHDEFVDSIINMYKPDGIIHLAGQTAVTTSMEHPEHDFETNVIGTFNILESIRTTTYEKYPKVIFASTNKVYGDNVEYMPVSVHTRIDQCHHSPYGTSKLCADLYVQEYCHSFGIPAMVARMSCIYGPRQFGVEDQGWVAHFVISAYFDKIINIFGDGEQRRDLLYIDDLCRLYYEYMCNYEHDYDWPLVFNVGGGEKFTMSLNELLAFLKAEFHKPIKTKTFPPRPADQKKYISDITPLNQSRTLRWEPQFDPATGIRRLIEWVEINRGLWMDN